MLTKSDKQKLNHCFKSPNKQTFFNVTYFQILDVPLNKKLSKIFGLFTDENEHELDGYKFWFNWHVQMWYVAG